MRNVPGIKIVRDRHGKPKQVVIDISKHEALIEDLLDTIDVQLTEDEEMIPAKEVFKKLDKKHGR